MGTYSTAFHHGKLTCTTVEISPLHSSGAEPNAVCFHLLWLGLYSQPYWPVWGFLQRLGPIISTVMMLTSGLITSWFLLIIISLEIKCTQKIITRTISYSSLCNVFSNIFWEYMQEHTLPIIQRLWCKIYLDFDYH